MSKRIVRETLSDVKCGSPTSLAQSEGLTEWHRVALSILPVLLETLIVATQLFKRALWYEDVSEQMGRIFSLRDELTAMARRLDDARIAALPLPQSDELAAQAGRVDRLDQSIRRSLDTFWPLVPGFVALSARSALHDPTGRMADHYILYVYGLQSPQLYGQQGWKLGLHLLFIQLIRDWPSYSDRGKPYFTTVIVNETLRDIRDQDLARRDALGFAPKDQRRSKTLPPELRGVLNRSAVEAGDVHDPLRSPLLDPEAAWIEGEGTVASPEELETMIRILDEVATDDQRRLLDKMREGYGTAEALQDLGMPWSVYNSLVAKIGRRLPVA